jgi:hypothetical protein
MRQHPHSDFSELFPFFNWSLFSTTSNENTNVTIRLESVNDKPLPSPRWYYDMGETFISARERDSILAKTIGRLAAAIYANDKETISKMRRLIEDRYMVEVKTAQYDVIRLTYDPIKRLRNGDIKETVVVATYKKVPHD